ncbi:MAG: class I poly(R)-hydroxyalkanoic acid synthase [Burkholderiales bacterium]|nr:class I poly(R)-hydroxyalkanoic acid synthase [Burkholderiales bacterium]
MSDTPAQPDPLTEAYAALGRMLLGNAAAKLGSTGALPDPAAMMKLQAEAMAADSERWLELNNRYYRQQLELWQAFAGTAPETPKPAPPQDRRFRAPEWQEPYFNYLANSYMLSARWLEETAASVKLEGQVQQKLQFYTRQLIDALSPANFPWTNPEAIKLAAATEGDSINRGLKNLAADINKGLVTMTDETAFEVGRNLAVSPGAVVYENDFIQLIQYAPLTATVFEKPLLIVPPCINKYYILDLQPENSFVRHAVEQGHTVFMVSWRNMPLEMGSATWDDYIEHGVLRAIEVARDIGGVEKINALGFCVGGTLLACALAVLRGRGEDPVASLTLLTTMLDFSDTGELSVFVDEAYVAARETEFAGGGVLRGRELALTFASLRANDLIWPYVVNNYLKGNTPPPFDLLYWNGDGANLPGTMYCQYIRQTYLENRLREPGALTMCGVSVDLGTVDMPAYILAAREDHIVPWRTAYASTALLGGPLQFVLAASGHIAGVINPPAAGKRNHWVRPDNTPEAEAWLEGAESRPGSWWPHWAQWLAGHAGNQVPAPSSAGNSLHAAGEAAPGRYVRERMP